MAPSVSANSSSDQSEIDKTLELLRSGKDKIRLEERYRNMTLVLGITGAGKSTFVQWLAGDNSKLISQLVPGTRKDYIVVDPTRISNSTTQSMTVYPELVVDPVTDNAYYDCPGFSDTRSVSVDIAGTYFIKSVADYAQNVRLIFAIGHNAVRMGMDRRQFTELLKHSTNLVKNVDKFRNSIALVVTKVDNVMEGVDERGNKIYEPDESVIESIAQYLIKVRQEQAESENVNENFLKFIDVFLQKDGEDYSRIAIFRRPDMPGPLSEIPLMQKSKVRLMEMVKRLELTPINQNDFGYSISDGSKNNVHNLANEINERLWKEAETIVEVAIGWYRKTVAEISYKFSTFVTSTSSVDANLPEAYTFLAKLKAADKISSELSSVSSVTVEELADKFNYTLAELEIDTLRDNVERISLGASHLEFLQNVTDSKLVTKPWQILLKDIVDSISSSKGSIQAEITDTTGRLVSNVQAVINVLGRDLWQAKLAQMQSIDIRQLPIQLEQEVATMRRQIEPQPNSLEELASVISRNVESLGLETSHVKKNILTLFNSGKYLDYVQALSDERPVVNTWSPEWASPLVSTVKSFSDSLEWYRYLNGLYTKLGEYEFQQDPSQYNVANLNDWGSGQTKHQNIQIDENNFRHFLDITNQYDLPGYETLKDTQVAQWQLNELNQVLSLTLKQGSARIDCTDARKLTITGDYVKLSDLKKKLVELCPSRVNSVNIFASNTVFIDSDLDSVGDKLQLTLMAPKWEVVGQRRINLDGSAGRAPQPAKATSARYPGDRVQAGKPGLPGGSAGSFLGVAQWIVNREDLTVTANGGVGGGGQEGGDGAPGENGKDAPVPEYNLDGIHKTGFKTDFNNYANHTRDFAFGRYYTVTVHGKDGSSGGRGGDGGTGGSGGKPGQIQLFNLNESTKQNVETTQGKAGSAGAGGRGGFDGKHGSDVIAQVENWTSPILDKWKMTSHDFRRYEQTSRGQSGSAGTNRADMIEPEAAALIQNPATTVNEFKKYLRENLNGVNERFKRNATIALIDAVDEQTTELYDSLALAGELESLEKQSRNLSNRDDSIHFYSSLSSRINAYVASPKSWEKSLEYKKLFNYLSAATLSKLYHLQSGGDSNLVIDVERYLKYVQENMNTLNQLQKEHNEHEVVQEHKRVYHENLEQQIKEAKHFVETQIKPEFVNIGKEIDAKINRLIADVAEMEKQAEKNKEALIKQRKELQKNLVLRSVFSVISVASQVTSFLGPHCAAIGSVVGGASSLAEGFVLGGGTSDVKEFQMPPGIKDNIKYVEKEYKSFFANPAEQLKTKLSLMSLQIREEPQLNDLVGDLESISSRIPSDASDADYLSTVEELEEEAKKTVFQKVNAFIKGETELSDNAKAALDYANKIVKLGGVVLDRYNKHRGDNAKIAATDNAIKGVEGKITQIEAYRNAITNTMAPDMRKLMGSIDQISRNLDNKSLVALDIQQWKAQGMLKNLKLDLHKFIKGQEVEADMMRCFEKLDEAMAINIKLYDRIQNFQQQQQLADFIANVNSPTANSIKIGDPELARAVNKLEILIRSNVVLQEFDTTVAALKQMVFPYARHYLHTLTLPSELSLNDTYIDEMVMNANAALDKMRSKVIENKTTISKVDRNTRSFDFDSTKPCIQAPFYVWSGDEHSSVMAKLLAGEPVALKADIRHSDPAKDAIKFIKVLLNFKARNAELQPEIDAKLEKFKISANHTGNSYYRYGGKYYVIDHEPLNIEYSFAKRPNGYPIESSIPFDKIQEGTLTLSPYTMWNIQLVKMAKNVSFDQLAMYKDVVDLELVGPGRFIKSQDAANDDLLIDQFYSEYVDEDDAETDVEEQSENEQFYSVQVMNQMKCRKFVALNKASNSLHRINDGLPNEANNSYFSRLGQTVSNFFGGRSSSSATPSSTNIATHPGFEYTSQQSNDNTNSLSEASNSVDVHGNLLMGQLLVGLIAGKNNTIASDTYLSPEQSREVQVDRLAQRVVPALSSDTRFRSNQIHNRNTQWHRDWNSDNSRKQD